MKNSIGKPCEGKLHARFDEGGADCLLIFVKIRVSNQALLYAAKIKNMKAKFNLSTKISINDEIFVIVGIDFYKLLNCHDKVITWKSYTLLNEIKRVGIAFTCGEYILWENSKVFNDVDFNLNLELSGVCEISFSGDPGPSTPLAELIWFNSRSNSNRYSIIEKFIHFDKKNDEIKKTQTFFQTGTIIDSNKIKFL